MHLTFMRYQTVLFVHIVSYWGHFRGRLYINNVVEHPRLSESGNISVVKLNGDCRIAADRSNALLARIERTQVWC
jgi:hypothetical protein